MSYKKDSGPPPRPPAPRVGLGTKSSSGNSIKISFKSLEEEDEEDLTVFTGEYDKKVERDRNLKESSKPETGKPEIRFSKAEREFLSREGTHSKLSKSLDDDKSLSNVSKIKQNLFEFSSGLKDRLAKKLEEFSSETNTEGEVTADDLKALRIKQETGNQGDFQHSSSEPKNLNKLADDSNKPIEKESVGKLFTQIEKDNAERPESVSVSAKGKDDVSCVRNVQAEKTALDREENKSVNFEETSVSDQEILLDNSESIDIVDDFFEHEPSEDFTGTPTVSSQLRKRSSKGFKSVFKNRPTPSTPQEPMSMSTLEKNTEENDNSIYFDPQESMNKSTDSAKKSEETSKNKLTPVENKVQSKLTYYQKIGGGILFLILYWFIPLPSFVSGMIFGTCVTSAVWFIYVFLTKPAVVKPPHVTVPLDQLPPMVEPEMKTARTTDGLFKGWMNEIPIYNPDNYHINKTHSVHVDLENSTLRLRRPKVNIPKRAMFDDSIPQSITYIHQRHYDLKGSRIFLLPPGLVKKRIWSKKYPICIALASVGTKRDEPDKERTPDSEDGFEIISEQKCDTGVLYLFARTCREKEDWYKRFEAAALGRPLPNHVAEIQRCLSLKQKHHRRESGNGSLKHHQRHGSTDSASSTSSSSPVHDGEYCLGDSADIESFAKYMGRLMPKEVEVRSPKHSRKDSEETSQHHYTIDCEPQMLWFNALIGRCFWDFLRQKYWADKVMDKLQRKLAKIHTPYFIEEFKITNIDLGNELPVIRRAGKPYIDEDGFWVDLDVNYEGGFEMTIETKVNLMKLTENKHHTGTTKQHQSSEQRSAITHSDEEDSAESSTDEEEETSTTGSEEGGGKASKKFLYILDKVTRSKYFKSATEMKYIKKAMEEVSNTPLVLAVELRYLSGTLAINIPPPPSDRFWYGFRFNPKLTLVAKPKVGARQVTVTHITEWIEKKLSIEFQRVLVMPNMDDLEVPILMPDYQSPALPTYPSSQLSGSEV